MASPYRHSTDRKPRAARDRDKAALDKRPTTSGSNGVNSGTMSPLC